MESKVPVYELPDILQSPCGQPIATLQDWENIARPALHKTFSEIVYGITPNVPILPIQNQRNGANELNPATDAISATILNQDSQSFLGGKAILHQVRLEFSRGTAAAELDLLVVLPAHTEKPVPAIVALNFWGNHTIHPDPAIQRAATAPGMQMMERGSHARRWNLEELIDRGYAVATAFRGQVAPENTEHYATGILSLFPENTGDNKMGSIGAWAWSLSRIADYLITLPEVDASRLIVAGHSRLGKSALWAAAQDQRFAAVFANNSGCMGAALSRRRFGETLGIITRNFPYWFAPALSHYAGHEADLPVDQHQLLALIAPRPVHLGAAEDDLWADPRGEFLALREASRVTTAIHSIETKLPDDMPPANATPVGNVLSFHMRQGAHDLLASDWNAFLSAPAIQNILASAEGEQN